MKYSTLTLLIFLLIPSLTRADSTSPIGEWVVKDGDAHVHVLRCGDALWGVISWLQKPGMDENNPDPDKRKEPLLGLPILRGAKDKDGMWVGTIYNSENGKLYDGNIRLVSADMLHIEGCLFGGFFCGGEDWKRVSYANKDDDPKLCRSLLSRYQ